MRATTLLFLFSGACRVLDACPDTLRPDGEGGCVYVDDPTEGLLGGTYGTGDLGWTEDPHDAVAFVPADFGIQLLHEAIDWRSVDGVAYVTAVADQGPYATDVFFASTAAIESAALIQGEGIYDAETLDLSEQFRLDCSTATIDGYTLAEVTNDWADGSVDEAERAYTGLPSGDCPPSSTSHALEAVYLVERRDLKAALHLGPVLTRFDVYENFPAYTGGIYEIEGAPTTSGHAVLIVGYDDREQYWIVKNSWGPTWGEDGYVRVAWDEPGFAEQGLMYVVREDGVANGLEILRYGDCIDADGDGWVVDEGADCPQYGDCDDGNPAAHPERPETCDEVDDNCDGQVDEDTMGFYYVDADGDGSGDGSASAVPIEACHPPPGYEDSHNDCDDSNALVRPGLPEHCDFLDNNCNSVVDEGLDIDGDGMTACAGDCDDEDPGRYDTRPEVCNDGVDQDCDDLDTACLCDPVADDDGDNYYDADGMDGDDFTGSEPEVGTCLCCDDDDNDALVNPGAPEICDYKDNDQDDAVDEDVLTTYWRDSDGDGRGDEFSSVGDCSPPAGYVLDASDCDDTDELDYPGASEICQADDGSAGEDDDENCEGNGDDRDLCDVDGDGWDVSGEQPYGDCDDHESLVSPGQSEVPCSGVNEDCNDTTVDWVDNDADGHSICSDVPEYDCDDRDAGINPSAPEYCDGVDTNCNSAVDDVDASDSGVGPLVTVYDDADRDGYGDPDTESEACETTSALVDNAFDCNDADASVSPASSETCDGEDDDCDETVDDDAGCPCLWEAFDGHAYMFCSSGQSWEEAARFCANYGYDLVMIESAAENAFVLANLATEADTWIGVYYDTSVPWCHGTDTNGDGDYESWAWYLGESDISYDFSYDNWQGDEPNFSGSCGQMYDEDGAWDDTTCTTEKPFVCEQHTDNVYIRCWLE